MKEQSNITKARLNKFKELYENALLANEIDREKLAKHMEQYLGSDEIDGSTERACVVRNITFELIESEINAEIPVPKVDTSCYSAEREINARAIERLCSSLRSRLPFEELNDRDERFTYIYGGSVFYVEWEDSGETSEGGIRVHLLSPTDFIPQPCIQSVEDMEYCFLHFTTTRSELILKYGIDEKDVSNAECEYLADLDNTMGDAVAVIVAFYRDENGEVGKFVFSGDLVLSDMPSYYKRKLLVCRECGKPFGECSCAMPSYEYINVESEPVTLPGGEKITIPYYIPKDFPVVVRKNSIGDSHLYGGSDCERIRSQQQSINKVESRILQKLLRAGVTPIMPEGTAVSLSNAVFGQIIKTRPGESIDNYGKIDTTPDISQDIEEANRLYDQAKRVLGISDALQGLDSTSSESGYARQLKIARASSRLESKKRMKHLSYSKIYELIFKHYLAFADEPETYAYRDTMDRMHLSEFNRYDFIERDKNGSYYYDDSYLFSVDTTSGTQYQTEALWEINLQNLERGTLGPKESPATLMRYWQLQDKAHFPYARENVEYFKDMVSKKSADSEDNTVENDGAEKPDEADTSEALQGNTVVAKQEEKGVLHLRQSPNQQGLSFLSSAQKIN